MSNIHMVLSSKGNLSQTAVNRLDVVLKIENEKNLANWRNLPKSFLRFCKKLLLVQYLIPCIGMYSLIKIYYTSEEEEEANSAVTWTVTLLLSISVSHYVYSNIRTKFVCTRDRKKINFSNALKFYICIWNSQSLKNLHHPPCIHISEQHRNTMASLG